MANPVNLPLVTLTPAEAAAKFDAGEIALVDVREANEWAQARIPGAVLSPLSTLAADAANLPTDKPVVFYCMAGGRSAKAVALVQSLGIAVDTHVGGGITAWAQAGLPIER
ncbi:rhodanese-like domain-containing protein [Methyloraptor flagellatus]|uniref:Rhodanese-like domain-containing protein n=1 Tax=Methyloraptor flagellatus TaxID=3162530 RepID=A0AAU7XCB8_9HYPH